MKTNKYLDEFIDSHVLQDQGRKKLQSLYWEDTTWGIRVEPECFNYFSFKIITKDGGSTLQVDQAKKLAIWLLNATDGIDDTHGILNEIVSRQFSKENK